MKLSKRQKAFADAYLTNGGNATEAARVAGYSPHNIGANAAKNLKSPKIQAYMKERLQPIERKADLDVDKAIAHLLDIGMGREIKARSSTYDNIKKRMLEDTTISYSPGAKQQVEALELYLKYKGVLRNASKDLEDAQTRKAKAEADMAEARAEDVNNGKKLEPMEFVMPELMKESETDAGDDNKETGD
ncbi:terminase small subunit [Lacticaseibacillus rhamnosus]|uniref:terminase small subunit n=1 Tax=Lacticaseibacillus rhamnosus TaxID=47715 RepID=UPI00062A1175|nr:terminase small subunit [Lacticaseibacillus rhamnosus]KKW88313.1 terminase [Lacticaseibacillus rhamnosus]MCZ2733640.1 terminase small subunit [Lacticaseibacillus rhamnosus]MCZ2736322.1 terminase small subunit [Lacticaseibacillus rhamnosus]MCZ2742604.1 terminase small subunit [Lacticaseibacillus rhamnosus]MCZ2745347.1 terminase small subunit [Lacticaseibacillus rhamnosus]